MRVNELLADEQITVEDADTLYEKIMEADDDAPFPDCKALGINLAEAVVDDADDEGDEALPDCLDENWTPQILFGDIHVKDPNDADSKPAISDEQRNEWAFDPMLTGEWDKGQFGDLQWWGLPVGVLEDEDFSDMVNDGASDSAKPEEAKAAEPAADATGKVKQDQDMQWMDLPDDLQENTPSCDYMGGTLTVSMYGCMQQYDLETLSEFTEYVVLCSWGPKSDPESTEQWLVFTRYSEFREMHKGLRKRLNPVIAGQLRYPKYPRKQQSGRKAERLEKRLRGLQKYIIELLALFSKQSQLFAHADEMNDFLALNEHITSIKHAVLQKQETNCMLQQNDEQKKSTAGNGEGEGSAGAGDDEEEAHGKEDDAEEEEVHQPMNEEELQQTSNVIQQLWRLIINSQSDVREEYDIQHLLHICLGLLPRLQASADVGPFTNWSLIPMAEQCLYDMQEVIALYNDEALLYQIGAAGIGASDMHGKMEEIFGGFGAYTQL